jgi:glycosyltransferase involved in cell wall biosynthesis
MAASEKNRKWIPELGSQFKYKVLPGFSLNFFAKDLFSYHINLSIIWELIRNHYDIILSAGYASFTNQIAFFYSKICKKPFILWSGSTINEPSSLRKVSLPLVKFIVRHSDALIAYGTRAKDYLIHLGASPERIFVAYNTVDVDFLGQQSSKLKIKKKELKDELGIRNKAIVLYVGQLVERKGVKYLLKAYAQLKGEFDVALLIVGDGIQKNELEDLCAKEDIQDAFFVGYKQLEELPAYYAASDIFVLPSTEEVWGLVLNEAMACGLPVITTDKVGASVDLIKEGVNGYVVEAKNVERLYQAMKKILSNPELKQSMGNKSQQIINDGFRLEDAKQGFANTIDYIASKS